MRAGRRRGHTRHQRQFSSRHLAAVGKCHQDSDARRVGEKRRDGCDGGICKHVSMLSKVFPAYPLRMHPIQLLMTGIAASTSLFMTAAGSPQSMDPVVVNAKMEHVKLENGRVRVIDGVLQPGDREQMHSHPAFVTYIVAGSKVRNHFADGT